MQTLDEVVREYLIELGESGEHKYARLLQLGYQGVRQLHLDASGSITATKLTVSDTDTANLPEDYIDYLGIYVCDSDTGTLHPLGLNDKLCLPRDYDSCGDISRASVDSDSTSTSSNTIGVWGNEGGGMYRNGEMVGRLFGLGGGNNKNGYYRIDEKNRMIVFDTPIQNTIVLEYLADPQRLGGNYHIHPYDVEAVKAFIWWKDIQKNRTYNGADKEQARLEWRRQYNMCKRRHNNFTLGEAAQSIRKSIKTSPKF
jgi:hypothetical protein